MSRLYGLRSVGHGFGHSMSIPRTIKAISCPAFDSSSGFSWVEKAPNLPRQDGRLRIRGKSWRLRCSFLPSPLACSSARCCPERSMRIGSKIPQRNSSLGFCIGALIFAGLWTLPVCRVVDFVADANDYFSESRSLDSAEDVSYANALLAAYLVSILAGLAVIWLATRDLRSHHIFCAGLLLYAAIAVLLRRPEEPIVHIPSMSPWQPVVPSFIALCLAIWFRCGVPFNRRSGCER